MASFKIALRVLSFYMYMFNEARFRAGGKNHSNYYLWHNQYRFIYMSRWINIEKPVVHILKQPVVTL